MKKFLKWGGIILAILIVIGMFSDDSAKKSVQDSSSETKTTTETNQDEKKLNYEILLRKTNADLENISVLVNAGETEIDKIAHEVKKTCELKCNISIYDDKKAFELQREYDSLGDGGKILTPADTEAWRKKNYVYVADHLVARMDFDSDDVWHYPQKDWYYKELKGEK